jgi:hypothetical protein
LTVARAKFLLSRFGPLPEIGKVCHWLTPRVGVATFAKSSEKDRRDGEEEFGRILPSVKVPSAVVLSVESGGRKVPRFAVRRR